MGKPFRVTIDLGGGSEVSFDLTEEAVTRRARQNPRIGGALMAGEGRLGLRTAAYQLCLDMLDVERDPGQPVSITDDNGVEIIPIQAIRRIRLDDPETAGEKRPFGFADPVAATAAGDAKVTPIRRAKGKSPSK